MVPAMGRLVVDYGLNNGVLHYDYDDVGVRGDDVLDNLV